MKKPLKFLTLSLIFISGISSANTLNNKLEFYPCLELIDKNSFTCKAEENDSVRCFDEEMRSIFFENSNSVPYDLEIIKSGTYSWKEKPSFKSFNHFALTKNNIKLPELKVSLYINNFYRVGLTGFKLDLEQKILSNCK